jgi:hypothetical protein
MVFMMDVMIMMGVVNVVRAAPIEIKSNNHSRTRIVSHRIN